MADLPHEVITEILCRLAATSLLRFRSVSKSWCSLIDSPVFKDLHLQKAVETSSNLTLFMRDDSDIFSVDFPELNKVYELNHPLMCYNDPIKVLGTCNGLLCICNVADDIALWNPATRKYAMLPFLPVNRRPASELTLFGSRVYGFGYDSSNDDYKLVRISLFININFRNFDSEVRVYSLRTNRWRSVQSMPYALCYSRTMGVLVSEALHWVVTGRLEPDEPDLIVAFDLRTESFRPVPLPEVEDKNFEMELGVLGESISMLANCSDTRVDVWVMKEYGVRESWCKLFTVTQPDIIRSFKCLRPLSYSKRRDKVLLQQDHRKLYWFDLKSKRVTNIKIIGLPVSFEAGIYVTSLVSPTLERKIDGKSEDEMSNKNKRDDFLSEGFRLVL